MGIQGMLLELLLAGFFAVACIRARATLLSGGPLKLRDFFRLSNRLDRLQRSRWQWFSMVLLLLILRKQAGLPLVLELTVAIQFLIFLLLPTAKTVEGGSL